MTPEQAAALRAPFAPGDVDKKPQPLQKNAEKGRCKECGGYHGLPAIHLDYVGHAAATDRFLRVDPAWTWEPLALDERGLPAFDQFGGLWIRLTIAGTTRLGYGFADGKSGGNAIKEAIGDALRNAGMRFGVGLDLWRKEDKTRGRRQIEHDDEPPARQAGQSEPDESPLLNALYRDIDRWSRVLGLAEGESTKRFIAKYGTAPSLAGVQRVQEFRDALRREAEERQAAQAAPTEGAQA